MLQMRAGEPLCEVKFDTLKDAGIQNFLQHQLEIDNCHLVTEITVLYESETNNIYQATRTTIDTLEQKSGSIAESMEMLRGVIADCDLIIAEPRGRTLSKLAVRLQPRSA
jgi:hypothetical protein